MNQVWLNIRDVLDKRLSDIRGSSCSRRKRRRLLGNYWAKRFFDCIWGDCLGGWSS